MINSIIPENMSNPKATYSPGVIAPAGRLLFISGQVAFDAEGKVVGRGDIVAQARKVFENLRSVLEAAGTDFSHIIKTNYYVTDVSQFPKVSALRPEYFSAPFPASTMVEVKALVHPDLMLEIEAVAALSS